jgi:hypothetical protein
VTELYIIFLDIKPCWFQSEELFSYCSEICMVEHICVFESITLVAKQGMYCHVLGICDYTRGMDYILCLLTTYTHDTELQEITAPPLIFTL